MKSINQRSGKPCRFTAGNLTCHEPGCPHIETAIVIVEQPPKQYKIHKSIAEIQQSDIYQLKAK